MAARGRSTVAQFSYMSALEACILAKISPRGQFFLLSFRSTITNACVIWPPFFPLNSYFPYFKDRMNKLQIRVYLFDVYC
jgi:hypothetical protein